MAVRERVLAGKAVRVQPLAEELGISASGLYTLISQGKVASIKLGRAVLVPATAAAPLLGIEQPKKQAQAAA